MKKTQETAMPEFKLDGALMYDPVRTGAMARQLEAAGFDGAYTFEGRNDPFIGVAAAAASTSRLQLMTSIAVAFARNPMSLAYLANDLQLLSGGRFILGLGTQIKAHIERRFSMPWSRPAARMREMVAAIKAVWRSWETGERLDFQGEFYRHTLMTPVFSPGPNPHGNPPIYLAGVGPLMTRVAAEAGEGLFVHPFHTAKSMAELTLPMVEAGLAAAGKQRRAFAIAAQVIVATGTDEKAMRAAEAGARSQLAFYASTPAYLPVLELHGWEAMHTEAKRLSKAGQWQEMAALVDDDMLRAFAILGEPKAAAAALRRRFAGQVERVSPVIYSPSPELLAELLDALRGESGKGR